MNWQDQTSLACNHSVTFLSLMISIIYFLNDKNTKLASDIIWLGKVQIVIYRSVGERKSSLQALSLSFAKVLVHKQSRFCPTFVNVIKLSLLKFNFVKYGSM